ncbi:GILT-like protein 2 [Plodia interpunctella]|uniref:GILT-like protein 2 n=1 Tax=Plodia interpunctella TaxID=58824 RepID=UPI002367F771|nr:GILT-like protein 2 [Plodia interpunctella]
MIFIYLILFPCIVRCEHIATHAVKEKPNLKNETAGPDVVDVKYFYETFCPKCIKFERQFENAINLLSTRLFIQTYPYGKSKITLKNGKVFIKCQHGRKECYGNKLHACVLKYFSNHTEAVLFNICMMHINGSNDATAKKCSQKFNVNVNPILKCAKGIEGVHLLKYYGEESRKANFERIPFVLVNGAHVRWNGSDFSRVLCGEFKQPPPNCSKISLRGIDNHNGTLGNGTKLMHYKNV